MRAGIAAHGPRHGARPRPHLLPAGAAGMLHNRGAVHKPARCAAPVTTAGAMWPRRDRAARADTAWASRRSCGRYAYHAHPARQSRERSRRAAGREADKRVRRKRDVNNAAIAPAANARPGVADVDVLCSSPNEVYLLGKTIGTTNVVMLDQEGRCTVFDVVVGMDTTRCRR